MNFSDPFCLYSPMSIAQAIAKVNTNKEPMLPIFMAASTHLSIVYQRGVI